MAWDDNFNKLFENKLPIDEHKEWRFALEEHKTKGTMNMNVRIFQKPKVEGGYEGPTKSGFILGVQSLEQIEDLQKEFNEFFEKVKEML